MKVVLGVPLVIFGWYSYFTTDSSSTMFLVLMVTATIVVFLFYRSDYKKAAAANNIVAAAATFESLGDRQQSEVHEQAVEIIKRSGWRGDGDPVLTSDVARFGWYALAMAELDIPPICIVTSWNVVRNPFTALSASDSIVDSLIQIAKKQGVNVEISRAGLKGP